MALHNKPKISDASNQEQITDIATQKAQIKKPQLIVSLQKVTVDADQPLTPQPHLESQLGRPLQFPSGQLQLQEQTPSPVALSPQLQELQLAASQPSQKNRLQAFAGSFLESLLSGRMSIPSSPPIGFICDLGVISLGRKAPSHIQIPFEATFYHLGDDIGSPYSGAVSLSQTFGYQRNSRSAQGYKVPKAGQLQILIKNSVGCVKLFLVPYDLSSLPVGIHLLRQKFYLKDSQIVRHAVHVSFTVSERRKSSIISNSSQSSDRCLYQYHVSGDLRVVFSQSPPEEVYNVVYDLHASGR